MDRKEAYDIVKDFIDGNLIGAWDDPVWNEKAYEAIFVLLEEYKKMMDNNITN